MQEDEDEPPASVSDSVYSGVYNNSSPVSTAPPNRDNYAREPDKVVYITIDDGPDPQSTPAYLNILKQHNVKATFFMTGSKMEKNSRLVLDMYLQGHSLGNHTYTHDYSTVFKDTDSFALEVSKTEEVIYSITGTRPGIFRVPGGSQNLCRDEGFVRKLWELEYSFFDWNVSAADTDPKGITKEQVIDNIKRGSAGRKKIVVLMHDNPGRTASLEALPELIEWFKENGYEFGTLNKSIRPVYLTEEWRPEDSSL